MAKASTTSPASEADAAAILAVRPLEVATVARLLPRIQAAYAERMGDNKRISAGIAAQEARAHVTDAAIRAETDPAVRAELLDCQAALRRVDAVYWGLVERWDRAAKQVARKGLGRLRRDIARPSADDIEQDARYGLWRGILRWQPDAGCAPRTWAWKWAEATAQRGNQNSDLSGGRCAIGWRVNAGTIARRLDAPLGESEDSRTLLDTLVAPDDDADERQADARRQLAALLPTLDERERVAVEAYLASEGHTQAEVAAQLGVSRQRVQQIFENIKVRKGQARPPKQPTRAEKVIAYLTAQAKPVTIRQIAESDGTPQSNFRDIVLKLCLDGVVIGIPSKNGTTYGTTYQLKTQESPMPNDTIIPAAATSREQVIAILERAPSSTLAQICAQLDVTGHAETHRVKSLICWIKSTGQVRGIAPSANGLRVLGHIERHPGCTGTEIAERLKAEIQTVRRSVQGLALGGHILSRGRPAQYYATSAGAAPAPEPAPEPAPAPTIGDITEALGLIAAALGLDEPPRDMPELLLLLRDLAHRPAPPDPRVADLEMQIKALRADRDELLRSQLTRAEAAPPASTTTLTAAELERRIALWQQAADIEARAQVSASLAASLLPGEAELLRAHRLTVATELRARALRGE